MQDPEIWQNFLLYLQQPQFLSIVLIMALLIAIPLYLLTYWFYGPQARRMAQKMFGEPQLSYDLANRQIAAKTLMPRRAKPTSYRTASLRRNAQSTPIIFGDKNGFYRITRTHVKQPFDGAIGRYALGYNR